MRKQRENADKYYLYGAAIPILFILSNYIVNYSFNINSTAIYYSVFVIPFIYLFTYILYKRFGFKKTIIVILISIVLQLLVFLAQWIIFSEINTGVLVGTMLSVPFAQLITIGLSKLVEDKYEQVIIIFVILAIAVIFDNLVFLSALKAFGDKTVAFDMISLSNIIKVVIAFISAFIAKKLK